MSRTRRLMKARGYNIFLIVLTIGIPALLIAGTWLDRDNLFYGIVAAILAFLILLLFVVYPNWLDRID